MKKQKMVSSNILDEINKYLSDGWVIAQFKVVTYTVGLDIMREQKFRIFAVLEKDL